MAGCQIRFRLIVALLSALISTEAQQQIGGKLCDVSNGQANIILDIEESRGTSTRQGTIPAELPLIGDPFTEISLTLVYPRGEPNFILNGNRLQLLKPLDRDQDNISHVVFQVECAVRGGTRRRTIPVIVRVTDINDNPPEFINTPYQVSLPELTPVGSTVYTGIRATDRDAGVNGLIEYRIVETDESTFVGKHQSPRVKDGFGTFSIPLPHQGQVTLIRQLDYETTATYLVTVLATDRARNASERLSATTTLTVEVKDDDDQDPSFIYQGCMLLHGSCINPEYSAQVVSGTISGVLQVFPEKIQAVDMDSIQAPIVYSFLSGSPQNFRDAFSIDPSTGMLTQVLSVDSQQTKKFDIIVKAEEATERRRFTTAKLTIIVKPVDSSPPQLSATASQGHVDENAPPNTKVLDVNNKPIKFSVSDPDFGPDDVKPTYLYELTTTFFNIDSEGLLVVGDEKLDRDPPSPGVFRFQVVAREKGGGAASAPLTMSVALNDVNDNAPRLPMIQPIMLQAGDLHPHIVQVVATDNDEGINAEITYSIYHVSNNGRNKFRIDPNNGIIDAIGKMTAGEQYSITVQATDTGGKYSQTIVEVSVVPGANTEGPMFRETTYDVTISEGAPINSTVATILAVDPEDEEVTYSIVSGNDLRQFAIGDRSGIITIIRKLDREDLTRYQLVIKAEDEGGLSSTATVNIKVSDINDKNPEFINTPYQFSVKEGLVGAHIGKVRAMDADEGMNANISYSLPSDVPFTINPSTGDVMTSTALDYEQQHEWKFLVTAVDGGTEPRLATATVTVTVNDIEDELPVFNQAEYEATVAENLPDTVVAQVAADDGDTVKRVSYVLKQGPSDLFAAERSTGKVKTIKGLDYESESQYRLVIGTLENNTTRPGSTTTLIINVQDRNDIPPVFLNIPRPVTLDDDSPIGTKVATLLATDSDATAPGNKVRYEVVGRGKASRYFHIDPDLGVVTLRDSLSKEPESQFQVDVRAFDLGEPSLSSITSLNVFVRHVSMMATTGTGDGSNGSGGSSSHFGAPGFPDSSYTVHIAESALPGSLIKRFTLLPSSTSSSSGSQTACYIQQGDSHGMFVTNTTNDRECELRLSDKMLDFEKQTEYNLKLQLDTAPISGNTATNVTVLVDDENDNGPHFVYPLYTKIFKKEKYFAGVDANTKESGAFVIQVKAVDKDSGRLGLLEYSLTNGEDENFTIDPLSGTIRTKRSLSGVSGPMMLHITARDNPTSQPFNSANTTVVVNLVKDEDRVIISLKDVDAAKVKSEEESMITAICSATGLITGVEKVTGGGITSGVLATAQPGDQITDVWTYYIDPATELILSTNSSIIDKKVMSEEGLAEIGSRLSRDVIPVTVVGVSRPTPSPAPEATSPKPPNDGNGSVVISQWGLDSAFPLAIIVIAAAILLLGIAAIIYICLSWNKEKEQKERLSRVYAMPPRYDPVFVEPNLKEYETQVLQMSVPMDDSDSYHDLQLDFSQKNHSFSLDNVSYITKDVNGGSPAVSEAATTARASSIGRHNNNNMMGNINPSYHRSDEDMTRQYIASSPTNENVMFREKKDYSHSPFNYLTQHGHIVETTTEL